MLLPSGLQAPCCSSADVAMTGHVCRHQPGGSVGGEGRNACQHLVGHYTERVDVGAMIDVAPAGGLFWREIRGVPTIVDVAVTV